MKAQDNNKENLSHLNISIKDLLEVGADAAVLASYLRYKMNFWNKPFFKTNLEITEAIGLSRERIKSCLNKLQSTGIIKVSNPSKRVRLFTFVRGCYTTPHEADEAQKDSSSTTSRGVKHVSPDLERRETRLSRGVKTSSTNQSILINQSTNQPIMKSKEFLNSNQLENDVIYNVVFKGIKWNTTGKNIKEKPNDYSCIQERTPDNF